MGAPLDLAETVPTTRMAGVENNCTRSLFGFQFRYVQIGQDWTNWSNTFIVSFADGGLVGHTSSLSVMVVRPGRRSRR